MFYNQHKVFILVFQAMKADKNYVFCFLCFIFVVAFYFE